MRYRLGGVGFRGLNRMVIAELSGDSICFFCFLPLPFTPPNEKLPVRMEKALLKESC